MSTTTEGQHRDGRLSREAVWDALEVVLDPELDEPITTLGFVASLDVADRYVQIALRLPTYFCAPNFAYLMVADAHDVVAELPGVHTVQVRLLDHFASEEINAGVDAGDGFDAAFAGLSAGELEDLRHTFLAKAQAVQQELLASRLLRDGHTHQDLLAMRLGELPEDVDLTRLQRRRQRLGLAADSDALLLVDEHGQALTLESLPARLRIGRTTRVGMAANAGWCRGLLATRYNEPSHQACPSSAAATGS